MNHPFTEAYIAMAKAAEEIQAMRPHPRQLEPGEWCWDDLHFRPTPVTYGLMDGWGQDWFPRLDQFLGMLGSLKPPAMMANPFLSAEGSGQMGALIAPRQYRNRFEQVATLAKKYGLDDIDDEHELALCVVMREKFGKRWDGKEWVRG